MEHKPCQGRRNWERRADRIIGSGRRNLRWERRMKGRERAMQVLEESGQGQPRPHVVPSLGPIPLWQRSGIHAVYLAQSNCNR